jgi:uncharacterized protein (DUF362 family)
MGGLRRREFIGTTVAAGVGVWTLGRGTVLGEGAGGKSIVVSCTRDDATKDKKPNADAVKQMVHAAVCKLAGKAKPEEAWGTFVKKGDVVGVKINCLFGVGAATHPEVTAAVVEGCQMAGVPADKIIVWDREDKHLEKSGYTVVKGPGVRYIGVEGAWEDQPTAIATCQGKLAKILTQQCTALINVPILKTHSTAGVTMALKNHYGSFHNPNQAHENGCDPFIAELNALDCIRKKTRLIVADALLPVAEKGPQARPEWTWEYKTILASLDPVAIDYVGVKILDEQRAKINLPPIEPKCKCVQTAAAKGLGAADMSKIEIVKV